MDEEEFDSSKLKGIEAYGAELKKSLETWISISDILNRIIQVDDAVKGLAKDIGFGAERFGAMKIAITDSVQGIVQLGGNFQDVVNLQSSFINEMGRVTAIPTELTKDLFAATKATGQESGVILKNFKDIGINTLGAVEGMQKVIDTSRSSGVNAVAVSNQVLSNMSKMNQFTFQGGVEGLAKMAAQAVSLRVNMSSTLSLADRLFDPENAIEMAAAMQRLGATQSDLLDPLRLMDLAQNDPTELQNQIVQLSEKFVQLNAKGQFEIMPGARRQLMEISKAMGITYDDITKMALGSAELDKKMKEIDFGGKFTEDERKLIANMAEMGKGGEYVITTNEGEKNISELDPSDLEKLVEAAKPKTMEEIAKEQLTLQESMVSSLKSIEGRTGYALAGTKTSQEGIDLIKKGFETPGKILGGETLSTKSIRENLGGEMDNIVKELSRLSQGEGSFESLIQVLGGAEKNLSKFGTDAFGEIVDNTKKSFSDLEKSSNSLAQIMSGALKKIMEYEKIISPNTNNSEQIVEANDFVIKTLPEDEIRVVGGTNLDGNRNNQTNSTEIKIDFNLKIESNNPNIDTNQLMIVMEKQEFKQKMIESLKDIYTNGKVGQIGNMVSV